MPYFVTYQKPTQEIGVGIALRETHQIMDLSEALRFVQQRNTQSDRVRVPATMVELIQAGKDVQDAILTALTDVSTEKDAPYMYEEEEVKLMAPILHPSKNVFAVGLNYRKHNVEFTGSTDVPQYPSVFTKAPTSITGPEHPIESYPQYTEQLDYEAELAVVIGKGGKDIPKEKAHEHIFGYTIINDISVRDRQKRTSQWFLGKTMDTHCPMGPYLADKTEIEWPVKLEIMSRVNGEERQHSNTSELLFDIPTIISVLSEGTTLEPGDIIATGTCEGVGMGFNPPRFLKEGDVVEIEIERLGILRNTVI